MIRNPHRIGADVELYRIAQLVLKRSQSQLGQVAPGAENVLIKNK